jgi:hypothetical protein
MIHFLNTASDEMDSTAEYFLAQFVSEPFRREPRNVGVIVLKDGDTASRFVGEHAPTRTLSDDSADWDPSTLRVFPNVNAYRLWVDSWRRKIIRSSVREALASGNDQFHLIEGGEVAATGSDSSIKICNYLFEALVSSRGLGAAIDQLNDTTAPKLGNAVLASIRDLGIMSSRSNRINVPNPIFRNRDLVGASSSHRVSMYQESGDRRWAMETVDFSLEKRSSGIRRATYVSCEFDDLLSGTNGDNLYPITIIRKSNESKDDDEINWVLKLLRKQSQVFDWGNLAEKRRFLSEREEIARAA